MTAKRLIKTGCANFFEKEEIIKKIESVRGTKVQDFKFNFKEKTITVSVNLQMEDQEKAEKSISSILNCEIFSSSRGKSHGKK